MEMAKQIPVRENTGNLETLQKHRENSCEFAGSKDEEYCGCCWDISIFLN